MSDRIKATAQPVPLKLCPFCAGLGKIASIEVAADEAHYFVRCINCAAEGPWSVKESSAVRQWNARTVGAA